MIRRFLFTLFAVALALPAFGQSLAKSFTLNAANQCAQIGTSALPTIGIDISGTFSLTLTPYVAINGQTKRASQVIPSSSNTPQATITAVGGYSDPYVGGYDNFLLCVTSYVSGSVVIWLNPSPALNGSILGTGASGLVLNSPTINGTTTLTGAQVITGTNGNIQLNQGGGTWEIGGTDGAFFASDGAGDAEVESGSQTNAAILFGAAGGDNAQIIGATGSAFFPSLVHSGTKFTASGCSNSTTIGGATAGSFHSGTTGTCTVVLTFTSVSAATNGWTCAANDLTTPADKINQTTPVSTTQATLTGTTASGDVINFHCDGY